MQELRRLRNYAVSCFAVFLVFEIENFSIIEATCDRDCLSEGGKEGGKETKDEPVAVGEEWDSKTPGRTQTSHLRLSSKIGRREEREGGREQI